MQTKRDSLISLILEKIAIGTLRPGDPVPSRNQLARKYNISYVTVDKALRYLTDSGHLTAVRGSGTFVAPPKTASWSPVNRIYSIFHSFSYFNLNLGSVIQNDLDFPVVFNNIDDTDSSLYFPEFLRAGAGVVWYYPFISRIYLMDMLKRAGVPMLLLNRDYGDFDCIMTDAHASLREGISWLLEEGGRNFALIYARQGTAAPYRASRIIAAYENLADFGISLSPENVYPMTHLYDPEELSSVAYRIFLQKKMPKCIVLLDSEIAVSLITIGMTMGKKPGEDYFLLTFDNDPQLAQFRGVGMLEQMLSLFCMEAKKFFFSTSIDRSKPFRKYIKAELIFGGRNA